MEKVNLNAEFSEDGTYIRKSSLPTKKVKPVEVKEPVEVQEVQKPLNVKFISDNEFYLNGKHIIFDKWKVKTRSELANCKTFIDRRNVLVYNNLKEKVPLDSEEFNYVLYKIRDYSFKQPIKYTFTCSECGKEYEVAYDLADLYRGCNGYSEDREFTHEIDGKTVKMVFTHLSEKDFPEYENVIANEGDEFNILLIDFIYHIKSINDVLIEDRNKLRDELENWNSDVFEMFFNDYNSIKFYVDTVNKVKCPHCLKSEVFNFDEFPNFYPNSWSL